MPLGDKNQKREKSKYPNTISLLQSLQDKSDTQIWMELSKKNIDKQVFTAFYNFDDDISEYLQNKNVSIIKKFAYAISDALARGVTDKIPEHFRLFASDCYVLMDDYLNAISVMPTPSLSQRWSLVGNQLLSLRYYTKTNFETKELIMTFGAEVTEYCKHHLEEVDKYTDIVIPRGAFRNNLLTTWVETCSHQQYLIFNASPHVYCATKLSAIEQFNFFANPLVEQFVNEVTRAAENAVREDLGLPKVGEGWISETNLYYQIKQALSPLEVIQHASPVWLGKQHLDVFIPDLNVAIEYQGTQHDQAVDYFGGEESFIETQKRDLRKLRECRKNGVRIIYVRSRYVLSDLIADIYGEIRSE